MKRVDLNDVGPFDDRYVIQVDGGTIVNTGGNGILLNDFTILSNFTADYRTTRLMVKPDRPDSKVTWYPLIPVGTGKFYHFFQVVDKETQEIMPFTRYTINACDGDERRGISDKNGHSILYLSEKECNITITLN